MKAITTYGLVCSAKDERKIVRQINEYLATLKRTLSKTRDKGMLEAYLPFVLKHFYWNLNKGVGTYFSLYPNEDQNGQLAQEAHPECGWLINVRIDEKHPNYDQTGTESFVMDVLEATACPFKILAEETQDGA